MAKPISFGELDFKIVASMEETRGVPEPETPFRILILGDFSGPDKPGLSGSNQPPAGWRPMEVDRDNFDEVMAKIKPEFRLQLTESESDTVTIRFAELDDYHPDALYERLEVFQKFKQIRSKLDNPRTVEAAAKEVRSWMPAEIEIAPQPVPPKPEPAKAPSGAADTAGLLDQILDASQGRPAETTPAADSTEWSAYLRTIVKPYLVPRDDPQQAELESVVDAAAAALMRIIMHHPNFQALESAWRALHFLVYRLETDVRLKLYLLDISKVELAAGLSAAEDLRTTGIYKLLVEQTVETSGGEPWAVMAGNYTFERTRQDAVLLGRMAKIAAAAGAPFIAAAHPNLLGCDSLAQTPDPDDWQTTTDEAGDAAWQALQKLPQTAYLGLVLPRFLLRLPYGADTVPLNQFDFEEMADGSNHDDYLWGNPCFACVCLLGQAFSIYGWNLRPGAVQDINNLPMHVFRKAGETRTKPCAEVLLTERAAEIILDKGVMPLLSFRDQDKVRLARFQSPALPPMPLAGRWGM